MVLANPAQRADRDPIYFATCPSFPYVLFALCCKGHGNASGLRHKKRMRAAAVGTKALKVTSSSCCHSSLSLLMVIGLNIVLSYQNCVNPKCPIEMPTHTHTHTRTHTHTHTHTQTHTHTHAHTRIHTHNLHS